MSLRLLFIIILGVGHSQAQIKVEFEKRVNVHDIPQSMVSQLNESFDENVKVKWYYQEDGEKKVYEAKFNYNKKQKSVEFDLEGNITNIEILISKNEIQPEVLQTIETQISKAFNKYKILKIQKEYKGTSEQLFDIIHSSRFSQNLEIYYEIEVNAKQKKRRSLYEMIFNKNGSLVSKRKVKLKSTDILDY